MARRSRHYLPDVPAHIRQRGINGAACFFAPGDYIKYKGALKEGAERYGVAIHAYVLMTNHIHLLATPTDRDGISSLMQHLGRVYVSHINRSYSRTGALWESRHLSSLVQSERYLLTLYRYIELNPVRARMVREPSQYRWSSHLGNAGARTDDLLTPHDLYLALAATTGSRVTTYRNLIDKGVEPGDLDRIRRACNANYLLGSDSFKKEVERRLERSVGHSTQGRPALAIRQIGKPCDSDRSGECDGQSD